MLSQFDNATVLDDTETGFQLELEPDMAQLLNLPTDEFWIKLQKLGLTSCCKDLKEVRKRQRNALKQSFPPLLERLRERLATVCQTIPFFQQRQELYSPTQLHRLDDFTHLPFMRKRDLREHFPNELVPFGTDLAKGLQDQSLELLVTSGSTADRLQIIQRAEINRLPFGCDDLFGISIGGKQPRTAIFTTPVCAGHECHLKKTNYEERLSKTSPDLFLQSSTDPFAIQKEVVEAFCEDINRFQPTILAADGIYLQCLVRRARELGIQLPRVPLIQHGFEFTHQAALRDIRKAFYNVPVLNDYGASEENRLALECHKGSLHVRSDAIYLEILGANGPCPPGVVGAVAITTFDSLTPLIRYLIGDAASWSVTPCDCEFADWPTIELHGRLKDMMRSKGRWVSTFDIDKAIGAPDWLDFYQVHELQSNTFEAQVIPALGASVDHQDLTYRLSGLIDPAMLRVKTVSRFDPLSSLKIGLTKTQLAGAPCLP